MTGQSPGYRRCPVDRVSTPANASPAALPYRGAFGAPRPPALRRCRCRRARCPRPGLRPLKAWRYVGVFGPELMLCAGAVRIGPARQCVLGGLGPPARAPARAHRDSGAGASRSAPGRARCATAASQIELDARRDRRGSRRLPGGGSYAWTRKQGGIRARRRRRARRPPDAARRAGGDRRHRRLLRAPHALALVGRRRAARDGRALAWNLVAGVNDPPPAASGRSGSTASPREAGAGRVRRRPDCASTGSRFTRRGASRARARTCVLIRSPTASRSAPSPASCPAASRSPRATA